MLDEQEISAIKGMLKRGDRQSDIAAWFGCNAGRIAEINTGQRGSDVKMAAESELPPPGPYVVSGRSAMLARATLLSMRELIDDVLKKTADWDSAGN